MIKPNLFNYATSELSQDAIICWLLEWAKEKNKTLDAQMHNLGIAFINSFFSKYEDIEKPGIYHTIEIKKQYKKIDVLCIINNEFAILIEDKTDTIDHSGQLRRYLNQLQQDFEQMQILPIYFKTGDQSSYEDVIDKGYAIYTRNDFLKVLDSLEYQNDILFDYHQSLQNLEDSVNSFKTLPLNKWSWDSWKGFYIALRKELGDGNWDYVANPSGGFLGFWWSFEGDEDCKRYLQIESKYNEAIQAYDTNLCIKIYVRNSSDRRRYRDFWYKKLKEKCSEYSLNFKKPSRFGSGTYMSVLVLEDEYRQTNNEALIEIERTIQSLNKAKLLIQNF